MNIDTETIMKALNTIQQNTQPKTLAGDTMPYIVFMQEWFKRKKEKLKVNTYDNYYVLYKTHVQPAFSGLMLSEVTKGKVEDFVSLLKKKSLSSSTINTIIKAVVSQSFKYAVDEGYINKNPAKAVYNLPKLVQDHKRALTDAEIKALMEAARPHRLWIAIPLLLYTGLRIGELLALKWEDINLEDGTITVNKNYVYTVSSGNMLTTTKNAYSNRLVAVNSPVLFGMLKEYKEAYGKGKTYVLSCIKKDAMIDPQNFRKRTFRKWCTKAGFPEVTFHYLRHTFITLMFEAGIDPSAIMLQVGHRDLRMINTVYLERRLSSFQKDSAHKYNSVMDKLIGA